MTRIIIALTLAVLATATWGGSRLLVRRVAMQFEPGASEVPADAAKAIQSLVDEAKRECQQPAFASVNVEEVRLLPLGRVTAGPTQRTHEVAAAVHAASGQAITPYEASLAPDSERARRIGLKADQVLIELTCPERGG